MFFIKGGYIMKPSRCLDVMRKVIGSYELTDRHAKELPIWKKSIGQCEDVFKLFADCLVEQEDGVVVLPVTAKSGLKGLPARIVGNKVEIDVEELLNQTITDSFLNKGG